MKSKPIRPSSTSRLHNTFQQYALITASVQTNLWIDDRGSDVEVSKGHIIKGWQAVSRLVPS